MGTSAPAPIGRRLRKINRETGEPESIPEGEIATMAGPVVILGDPGLGKSVLARGLGSQAGNRYVRAGTFVRDKAPCRFLPRSGAKLVIDGLDEVASNAPGGGVDAVLSQLSALDHPPFILSSREADWRGASARVEIEDDYGEPITVLHLEPFSRAEAHQFLRAYFPEIDADAVLEHLTERGLEEIYGNPLTLGMIGEVARAERSLPATRADLLSRACAILASEENDRHLDAAHAQCSEQELLLAAGAVCASLLLCDLAGVYLGAAGKTPDEFLHLCAVAALPLATAAPAIFKTRLFQADGEGRFIPAHRVIAEYLGAQWLAACFERGVSERRIRALISQGGVPTSLRGLNAWLAHFSGALAPACIAADPYAVLRYGNAETLPLEQARILLRALAELSSEDPYFRAEDWGRHSAAGLMREELKDDLVELLSDEAARPHLTFLLLESLAGSPAATALAQDLERTVFDAKRVFGARSRAADALVLAGALKPLRPALERLLAMGDHDSQRLAFELLSEAGVGAVDPALAAETLLAYAGVTVSALDGHEREHILYIPPTFLDGASTVELRAFLDQLADYAGPLMAECGHWSKEGVADAARRAVLIALGNREGLAPERVWRWLQWLGRSQGYDDEARKGLAQLFAADWVLRRGIQAAVVLAADTADLRLQAFELADVCSALHPDDEDLVALIELYGQQARGATDLDRLRELVMLGRSRSGLAPAVREAAIKLARADAGLLADLEAWSHPVIYEYEIRQKERAAAETAARQETYRLVREDHTTHAEEIRSGSFRWLAQPSKVYLGRFPEFREVPTPEGRVAALLGEDLAEDALSGFMAALHRDDLPSAEEIATLHAKGREWTIEIVLVCGVAEMVRRGVKLGGAPLAALEAAYMAWRRQTESNVVGGVEIGPVLEKVVLEAPADAERFFRTSIEPQLDARLTFVHDLYQLTHDARWPALAGKLAAEWLVGRARLPPNVESELLDAALRYSDGAALQNVLAASRERVHANREALLGWLAADFVLDFDNRHADLLQAARDEPHFLWNVRQRAAGGRRESLIPLTVAQRGFIVEAFGERWPNTPRPEGGSTGDRNPWDASAFIERAIYSLAAEPSAAATQMLQQLLAGASASYGDTLRHALAQQRRLRRDREYTPAALELVTSVASGALPETIDDMRAYFGDKIGDVQDRMHATNTDMWEAYWDGPKPRPENFCRNRLVEHISSQLPAAIRFEPEMHMPGQTRADIAAIRDAVGLPVEIKGQWHKAVWDAPVEQLAARYARDWHAQGRGVYIVLWFGTVPGKVLTAHPDGLEPPATPATLEAMLTERIPEALRGLIDIYVIDVSRPG